MSHGGRITYITIRMQTKAFLCLSILLYSHHLVAQFAHTEDPDGYVNLRSWPAVSSPVLVKVYRNEVFWCFEPQGEWYPVDMLKNGKAVSGYIHQSRVRLIEQLPPVPSGSAGPTEFFFRTRT